MLFKYWLILFSWQKQIQLSSPPSWLQLLKNVLPRHLWNFTGHTLLELHSLSSRNGDQQGFFSTLLYYALASFVFMTKKEKNQKYNNNNNCKKLVNKSHLLPPTSTNHMYSPWSNHQSCVSRRNGGVAYPWIHQSSTFLGRGRRRISAKLIWTDFKKGKTTLTRK